MHDLLKYEKEKYVRIVADTVDEHSAIDYFNLAMARDDPQRFEKIQAMYATARKRTADSGYALIRHGAQTSFMCYLHGITGSEELKKMLSKGEAHSTEIPWENTIMNIDPNICMFDHLGNAYILNDLKAVYGYYKKKDLLLQIPFYYFFKDIKAKPEYKKKLDDYAAQINEYLRKCYAPDIKEAIPSDAE